MSKLLSDATIAQYREDGYYSPVRIIGPARAAACPGAGQVAGDGRAVITRQVGRRVCGTSGWCHRRVGTQRCRLTAPPCASPTLFGPKVIVRLLPAKVPPSQH